MSTRNEGDYPELAVWIGLATVAPRPDNSLLGSAAGAVTPIVALAYSQDDFASKAIAALNSLDFELIELEDVEPFAERLRKCNVVDSFVAISESVTDENPIAFGTFQTFRNEGD